MQRQNPEIQDQIANLSKLVWYAAYKGDIQNLKLLLESELTDVDFIFNGVTPLWVAAQNGHTEVVEELIKNGANINFKHDCGQSVLWTAASTGQTQIVNLLLQQGALINEVSSNASPLWVAVQNNHLDTVKELIKNKGCDIKLPFQGTNETPLSKAAMSGNILIVQELLKANADVNIVDHEGNTALHAACSKGHLQIIKFLIKAGANINAESLIGRAPISYAYAEKRLKVVNYLLKHGASPDLSQASIIDKFLKYLKFYSIIHPNKYNKDKIKKIKAHLVKEFVINFLVRHF